MEDSHCRVCNLLLVNQTKYIHMYLWTVDQSNIMSDYYIITMSR